MPPILGRDRQITRKEVRGFLARSFIVLRRKLAYPLIVEVRDSYSYRDFAAMIGTPPQMDYTSADGVLDMADEPPASAFYEFEQEWINRLYKMKFWLSRALQELDQTGQVWTLLHSSAARMANFPDGLFFHRLRNATGTTYSTAYTGSALYATNHTIGASTINNIVTGTLFNGGSWSNTNRDALAQRLINDYTTAKARMLGFKDDRGEPHHLNYLEPEKIVLIVSPLLEDVTRYAFEAENIALTTNVMRGTVKAIVTSNYLETDPTDAEAFDWYMNYIGERNRPWVYSRFRRRRDSEIQDRLPIEQIRKVEGLADTSMEDLRELSSVMLETNLGAQGMNAQVDVMMHERFLVSGRWRGDIFPGEPRNTLLVNNSASS
jgi:hypothetical protein